MSPRDWPEGFPIAADLADDFIGDNNLVFDETAIYML